MKKIMENFRKNITNEAQGSGYGEGVTPHEAEKMLKRLVADHNKGGMRKILPGELEELKQWARDNVVGMTTIEAKEKIVGHLK